MFKKQGSFVVKGNEQRKNKDEQGSAQTIIEGLNYYQNKVMNAVNPYPVSDAALLLVTLRTFADAIEKQNPNSKALAQYLMQNMQKPDFKITEKLHKVK